MTLATSGMSVALDAVLMILIDVLIPASALRNVYGTLTARSVLVVAIINACKTPFVCRDRRQLEITATAIMSALMGIATGTVVISISRRTFKLT